jgi:hypothetical protein
MPVSRCSSVTSQPRAQTTKYFWESLIETYFRFQIAKARVSEQNTSSALVRLLCFACSAVHSEALCAGPNRRLKVLAAAPGTYHRTALRRVSLPGGVFVCLWAPAVRAVLHSSPLSRRIDTKCFMRLRAICCTSSGVMFRSGKRSASWNLFFTSLTQKCAVFVLCLQYAVFVSDVYGLLRRVAVYYVSNLSTFRNDTLPSFLDYYC